MAGGAGDLHLHSRSDATSAPTAGPMPPMSKEHGGIGPAVVVVAPKILENWSTGLMTDNLSRTNEHGGKPVSSPPSRTAWWHHGPGEVDG